jgi:hypothetical protein
MLTIEAPCLKYSKPINSETKFSIYFYKIELNQSNMTPHHIVKNRDTSVHYSEVGNR